MMEWGFILLHRFEPDLVVCQVLNCNMRMRFGTGRAFRNSFNEL